ncbi:hypothetical protein [Paraburkholderia youngii]|uniref:hypothetical protein n=1 Tax=Paraburkholderia youngii TaxID=2782701 RepID=UPI003D1E735B
MSYGVFVFSAHQDDERSTDKVKVVGDDVREAWNTDPGSIVRRGVIYRVFPGWALTTVTVDNARK